MIASATRIDEIADSIYRISTPTDAVPGGFSFNQFLIVDDDPVLFHTGLRGTFSLVKEAIGRVMPVEKLKYVSFSHFEADECGALNPFLAAAPNAVPLCGRIAAMTSINDQADRPPKVLVDGETLKLGRRAIQWHDTPHLPHGWESGLMSETTTATFFCGDLFTHAGAQPAPVTESDILGPSEALRSKMNYFSSAQNGAVMIRKLAQTEPRLLATMHGSSWTGDGAKLLRTLADLLEKK